MPKDTGNIPGPVAGTDPVADVPAGYPFPAGTPATVPADFEEAKVAALADQLTAEEIAEFRALRAEKKKRDQEAADEAAAAAARLWPPTHHVHLADGTVIEGSTIETHHATEDGVLIPVIGAYAKPEYVTL